MKVEIFSRSLLAASPGMKPDGIFGLQNHVNKVLALHSDATVTWLQTSFANEDVAEVTLTAIVLYSDCQPTTDKSD